MQTHHFFALDLGATSGRSILASITNGKLELKELTRFPNRIIQIQNKFYWNIFSLFEELIEGLKIAGSLNIKLDGIGIDTWGVDFVYIAEDGAILNLPRSYRDPYTNGIPEEYFRTIAKKEVYDLTGIQIMNFNSLFQLYATKKENSSILESAKNILFIPDALSYMLTGKQVCEYTIASTAQILNPRTKKVEEKLLENINIPSSLIQPIVMPGEVIGNITENIKKQSGLKDTPVIAVAGHDTGSAVVAVPAENENFAYLSSGTWSLMGIEVKEPIVTEESFDLNFTNEGGVDGTIRFLKNITGMWLLEQCRKEWAEDGKQYPYPEIVALSDSVEGFRFLVDPDDHTFANPDCMTKAIADYCIKTGQCAPKTHADYIRCIFDSLALKYKYVVERLQKLAPFKIEKLHVIGGGSQNKLLNQFTANSIGIPVVAGPSEATAIGNVMMQARGVGLVNSLSEIRTIVRNSYMPETFSPQDNDLWQEAYKKYAQIINHK